MKYIVSLAGKETEVEVDGFAYKVKVRNSAAKVVEVLFWEYQFEETANPSNLTRRQFLCGVQIKGGKEKDNAEQCGILTIPDIAALAWIQTRLVFFVAAGLQLGITTIIIAHVAFTISFVTIWFVVFPAVVTGLVTALVADRRVADEHAVGAEHALELREQHPD